MLKYKQIWHEIKPIRWLIKFNLTIPPASNIDVKISLASENLDKGKSILGSSPKLGKKDSKNPKAKKANSQKPKQKKKHLCNHCGVAGHTRPNCYKWLAIQ